MTLSVLMLNLVCVSGPPETKYTSCVFPTSNTYNDKLFSNNCDHFKRLDRKKLTTHFCHPFLLEFLSRPIKSSVTYVDQNTM